MRKQSIVRPEAMLPPPLAEWFQRRGWKIFPHQRAMLATNRAEDLLLIAPTGSGKTLAGFLPSLTDLFTKPHAGLHTLYLSPLKALANDIHRNLTGPLAEMEASGDVPVPRVETRTGDTPQSKRARQKKSPPEILLTTPESLALLLTYEDAAELFRDLRCVILDEVHTLTASKRGDQTALLLARLTKLAPKARRIGLSATVSAPKETAEWLGRDGKPATLIRAEDKAPPDVRILYPENPLPLAGHYGAAVVADVYEAIKGAKTSIVFVNTRAQVEMLFRALWQLNADKLAIALHHGSLTREQRHKVEGAIARGEVRAVVATSSLDLGVDWGDVDLVINVGAPKGLSRLRQRIGRSNHRIDLTSRALLVPTNRFEALECEAAVRALAKGALDDLAPNPYGALDVLAQHVFSCACAGGIEEEELFAEVAGAYPYRALPRELFGEVVQYVKDGGYVLRRYDRFARMEQNEDGKWVPTSRVAIQRHRMNLGTIVESEKLKVMRLYGKPKSGRRIGKRGAILGEVEERLVLGMQPGDTFVFAGQLWRYEQIREMTIEVTTAVAESAKIPAYNGGKMPLSTYLGAEVRHLMQDTEEHKSFPIYVQKWLRAQAHHSALPPEDGLLVETFEYARAHYLVAYPFEGRAVHQSLGFLITRRMEQAGLHPLGFTINDYGLAVWCVKKIDSDWAETLFSPELVREPLEAWIAQSAMLRRFFRTSAIIAGLIERKLPGQKRTGRQVTFSTDLIFDVLMRYEPAHLLLKTARKDAEKEMADLGRLAAFLQRVEGKARVLALPRVSPFAIPIMLEITAEGVGGAGLDTALAELGKEDRTREKKAEKMWKEAIG